jgi:hypothetical protein
VHSDAPPCHATVPARASQLVARVLPVSQRGGGVSTAGPCVHATATGSTAPPPLEDARPDEAAARQDKRTRDRPAQGSARHSVARQDTTGHDRTRQDTPGHDTAGQDTTSHGRTGHDKSRQDTTSHDRTRQDRTRHNTAQPTTVRAKARAIMTNADGLPWGAATPTGSPTPRQRTRRATH